DRQIVIGLGAFIEMASLAASTLGARLEVVPFPQGEPAPRLDTRPIAHLRLVREQGVAPDPLFAHIKARRTNRQPFDLARLPTPQAVAALRALSTPQAAVAVATDAAGVARLRDLTRDAWLVETETHRTHMESVDLMRIGRAEIDANP